MPTYRIPEENLDKFLARLDELNKKAAKLHCPAIRVEKRGEEMFRIVKHEGNSNRTAFAVPFTDLVLAPYVEVGVTTVYIYEVEGEAPRLNGWQFVAAVQWIEAESGEKVSFVFQAPNTPTPPTWANDTTPERCDHCHTKRFRKAAYIVHNDETDEWLQVGSSCLRDFTGHNHPEAIAEWAQVLAVLDDELSEYDEDSFGGVGDRTPIRWSLRRFLEVTALSIRLNGWLSRGQAHAMWIGGASTADRVLGYLNLRKDAVRQGWEKESPSPEDEALGLAAAEWMKALSDEAHGWGNGHEYLDKMAQIGSLGVVNEKLAGFAASAINAYLKDRAKELARQAEANSAYFGSIKEKVNFEAVLLNERVIDGFRGPTHLYRFQTTEGNIAVWFSSNDLKLTIGSTYAVKGTVVDHKEYDGVKQTVVNRCKLTEVEKVA